MPIEHVILALVLILCLSVIAQPIACLLRFPEASILVLLGFVGSELLVYFGVDTGLRADSFQSIIFYIFLPILVFESAYNLDKLTLKNNITLILSLAIIGMLLTCGITAVIVFYGIAHEAGFPWIAALITGAILAATDPVAVVAKLKEMKAPHRLSVLLEGESLFNDATAIVLFSLFLSIAASTSTNDLLLTLDSGLSIVVQFFKIFIGGALVGAVIGFIFSAIQKRIDEEIYKGVISLLVAYGSYLLAEHLMASGVMATLMAALVFSQSIKSKDKTTDVVLSTKNEIKYFWNVLSHIANASVFLIMGAVITLEMFEQRWLAMLMAVFALLIARAISVYGLLSVFSWSQQLKVSLASQTVMVWGGLRGAVTLALALSLPTSLDYWWTIQSIAFGVVIFSLFIQAPTMKMLTKKLLG